MHKRFVAVAIVLLFSVVVHAEAVIGYHDFAAVKSKLESLARTKGDVLELRDIGRSAAGAPLLVMRIAAPGETDPDERPAVFVGANVAGYHNAGTEAALHLIERLVAGDGAGVLGRATFYVAPALNPDAHDGMFRRPAVRLQGNGSRVDHDNDGETGEDGPNDLNGDGKITKLRIPDPTGRMLPDPDDPRVMIEVDPLEGQTGAYRVIDEGFDDDGDGEFNEDSGEGMFVDRNFAHAYRTDDPASGPWPGYTPESKAIMDFLLARRNIALAVVYGPANNLLAAPRSLGGGAGDIGSLKFKVPRFAAEMLGFDPELEYTIDEIWEVAKDLPFVVQNNVTKEQMAQFLGAGPATKPDDTDLKYVEKIAEPYKERLKAAGLDDGRDGKQYGRGGFTSWLYYQFGAFALELDVWGVPKVKQEAGDGGDALTLESLAEMSPEQFVALGEEKIAAFLKEIGAPPQFSAAMAIQRVESGQITPKQMAEMAKRMGAGAAGGKKSGKGPSDLMAYVDADVPEAFVAWTAVTLPDGTQAEVGGVDPFVDIAPPRALLEPALAAHTETVLDLAGRMARLEILSLEAEALGGRVHRVKAVAGNRGFLPTHTKMAERGRFYLPVRLEIGLGGGASLVTGPRWVTAERLEGQTGTLEAEWLVRVPRKGAEIRVELFSDNAGRDRKSLTLEGRK